MVSSNAAAVVVTATRTPRRAEDVPQTVDVITRDTMERRQAQDWKDLFRYEPGVSVGANADRFGIGDIRVRGLGGNRVRIQVDGVPVPDAFAIGSYSSAGRAMVDPGVLKQVDVVRGPGSALYGSDALGGVVHPAPLDHVPWYGGIFHRLAGVDPAAAHGFHSTR